MYHHFAYTYNVSSFIWPSFLSQQRRLLLTVMTEQQIIVMMMMISLAIISQVNIII
jgi:hypothetical protein